VLADPPDDDPEVILIAIGSQVRVALGAHERLASESVRARVVSLPCWELFEQQPRDDHNAVLPPRITARVAVEQATTVGWQRLVGTCGAVIGMDTFGASAPLKALATNFGFTPEAVARVARQQIGRG
jgi:transketolase